MELSSGIVVILNRKYILLAHPSNAGWWRTFSFPKGKVDPEDKTFIDTARREFSEETGLPAPSPGGLQGPYIIEMRDRSGRIYKKVFYFVHHISDIRQIGMPGFKADKGKLQKEEIDWLGFISKEEAQHRIHPKFQDVLKHF